MASRRKDTSKKGSKEKKLLAASRLKKARELAESPSVTLCVRIPKLFNEWLDEYKHLSYPERVGKQVLLTEGLILAFMRRGRAKEEILEFEDFVEGLK